MSKDAPPLFIPVIYPLIMPAPRKPGSNLLCSTPGCPASIEMVKIPSFWPRNESIRNTSTSLGRFILPSITSFIETKLALASVSETSGPLGPACVEFVSISRIDFKRPQFPVAVLLAIRISFAFRNSSFSRISLSICSFEKLLSSNKGKNISISKETGGLPNRPS